jgi:hypothetical protein
LRVFLCGFVLCGAMPVALAQFRLQWATLRTVTIALEPAFLYTHYVLHRP